MLTRMLMIVVFAILFCNNLSYAAQKPDDREAFAGLKRARVIFDVRVPDMEKLVFNLNLINETFDGMLAQGIKPRMVIAFRGPGVKLLTVGVIDDEAHQLIRSLKKKGIRIEVCSVATRVFKVENATIIPEVILVGNVFNSFIGYQNRGYAFIAIN